MVRRSFLRSLIFNICFYAYMIVGSFGLFWMFFIPRRWAIAVVGWYFSGVSYLERWILGLSYEVSGRENLPADGRYILAMKHQSAYETIKLVPVFGDVAIALKRELTWIPLWGWYTLKTGMIPIDRGARGRAMESLIEGGRKAMDAGRPIVIYPQGTRVPVGAGTDKYPYKAGVVRMAQALEVPIVPVAINSGVFWAKRAFIKGAGCVEFDIMPAINVKDRKVGDVINELEGALEARSNELAMNPKLPSKRRYGWVVLLAILAVLAAAWCGWWLWSAQKLREHIAAFSHENVQIVSPHQPKISGFPFKMQVDWADLKMVTDVGVFQVGHLRGSGWPIIGSDVHVKGLGLVRFASRKNVNLPQIFISLQDAQVNFTPVEGGVRVNFVELLRMDSRLIGAGHIFIPVGDTQAGYSGEMNLTLYGQDAMIAILQENGLIDRKTALLMRSVAHSLIQASDDKTSLNIPLRIINGTLYAHFIPVAVLQRAPKP